MFQAGEVAEHVARDERQPPHVEDAAEIRVELAGASGQPRLSTGQELAGRLEDVVETIDRLLDTT